MEEPNKSALVLLYYEASVLFAYSINSAVTPPRVADVFKKDNILCIRISDEGEHQKGQDRNESAHGAAASGAVGTRVWGWVEDRKAAGHRCLFPQAKTDVMNRQGNWIAKAFRAANKT
ncbi:hypothetical protein XAXN_08230 [Xanthomonas axonopodis]|uniref:Uncharacterized protein n=1 Tax=Xanthomonas axonopodis TaxID=53413 RepID=A0A0P6VTP3_9XANT|nr:hypothetical protein XAXN_08230 [Xanthomonas axonopodis]